MKFTNLIFIWSLIFSVVSAVKPFTKIWENTEVARTIDVGKSYLKEQVAIKIKNIESEPANQYIFGLPKEVRPDVSLVIAVYEGKSGKRSILQPKVIPLKDDDVVYYEIKLPYPIAPGSNFSFFVSIIMTNQMHPYPEHISMNTDQTLKVTTNAYIISPYDTLSYSLDFVNDKGLVVLDTHAFPVPLEKRETNSGISYKSNDIIASNTLVSCDFSFVRNSPLPYVNFLQRDLWVSHWSSILQLEEYYEVTNHAAKLDKGFSRAEYLSNGIHTKFHHSISALRIPFDQTKKIEDGSIYYVDKVGNVSTSQFYANELIIRPRYPLFGGWNYNFTIGWNYDLKQFLKREKDEYILTANILDGIYDSTYENVSFSIYLPEGADLIDYALPFSADEPTITHSVSYLDVGNGHLKITFHFENLIDEMKNLVVILRYRYTTYSMLQKPLQAAFYIFIALMGLYVLKKIDLSIKPTKNGELIESEIEKVPEKQE
jgi:oligosaccharyltransferase complex subunit alpha (ribophorin I)